MNEREQEAFHPVKLVRMAHGANEEYHGGLDELYERKLIPDACARATEESHQVAPYARVV